VETWEATRGQSWIIALGLIAITAVPMTLADTNYDNPAPPVNNAPPIRGLFGRAGINLALVATGRDAPARCCSPLLNRDFNAVGTDVQTRRDLLLLFPIETSDRITDLTVQVAGENGLQITTDSAAAAGAGEKLERRVYANDSGPAAVDGHHIQTGWVARVPIVLEPTKPWDIGGNRYPLTVRASYRVNEDGPPRAFIARAAVEAQIPGAMAEMGAASLVLPLVCFVSSIRRWRMTR
jgi:hypothetical protein